METCDDNIAEEKVLTVLSSKPGLVPYKELYRAMGGDLELAPVLGRLVRRGSIKFEVTAPDDVSYCLSDASLAQKVRAELAAVLTKTNF